MKRTLVITVALALVAFSAALAGHDHMAEAMNCHVCKAVAPTMGKLMPSMSTEIVTLDNGMAIVKTLSDESLVSEYHGVCEEMKAAGMETMEFSDEEASEKLCGFCQSMRGLAKAGASISHGMTESGSLMVVTAQDEATQKEIVGVQKMAEEMMGG